MSQGTVRVGTSGWKYPQWRGAFYPKELIQQLELAYASRQLKTLEINRTFYQLPKPSSYELWHKQTPEEFIFSVKAPRWITHVMQLENCEESVCAFLSSGLFLLRNKLGPIVWQFPKDLELKDDRLEKFIRFLPKTVDGARELIQLHRSGVSTQVQALRGRDPSPMKYAFDLSHPSFFNKDLMGLMRANNIAVVLNERTPDAAKGTADFVYARIEKATDQISKRIPSWLKEAPPANEAFIYLETPKETTPKIALSLQKKITLKNNALAVAS